MDRFITVSLFAVFLLPLLNIEARLDSFLRIPSHRKTNGEDDSVGTRWAVLIAGSSGYGNYRHQADICHAYQIMKSGGLKDENIVVFMYDDIANSEENPRPGVIINHPKGEDVYAGVPKDYVGDNVNVNNFLAVLLGNRSALTGGSGKVVDSGPDDHIFIFYSDHGGPGVLDKYYLICKPEYKAYVSNFIWVTQKGMPTNPYLYADDLNAVLKKKHATGTYKSMVFYLEACESGSIFEGLLPDGINIYATTASNAVESSWGTYCPGDLISPPLEYWTCLGDLYSVSWMEDSDVHNLRSESLEQQYYLVKDRTSADNTYDFGSHVMEYGNTKLSVDHLFLYMGSNPANDNSTFVGSNSLPSFSKAAVNQRDADLVYYWHKFKNSPLGSKKKLHAQIELLDVMSHRMHVDSSIQLVVKLLFGSEKGMEVIKNVRPAGQALVDDWDCLKSMVRTFETHCGSLSQYGMKHMRTIANICNAGVKKETMAEVAAQACPSVPTNKWSLLQGGFSA